MLCCVRCFNRDVHPALYKFILEHGHRGGPCSFCGTPRTIVIEPEKLRPLFEPLLSLYEPLEISENTLDLEDYWDKGEETLADLINGQFFVVSDAAVDRADELMQAIFTDGMWPEDVLNLPYTYDGGTWWCDRDQNFGSLPSTTAWDHFAYQLQYHRRFIPDESDPETQDPRKWLPAMLHQIEVTLPAGDICYRGRRDHQDPENMSAPPPEKATAGRANPVGIPFLYLASDRDTAVAELRPWRGQELSIAEFTLTASVRVADLTREVKMGSPFDYGEGVEVSLYHIRDQYRILRHLGQVLSIPIDPTKADIEYIPTQYLTEVIRAAGYGGMIFQSSLGPGKNLVLFSPDQAKVGNTLYFNVERISYVMDGPLPQRPSER